MKTHNIYLVPGFFGFTKLGALNYFRKVDEMLKYHLEGSKDRFNIIECFTQPTGSITHRASRLMDQVMQSGGLEADYLHFIGHSTGGLDVRLLLTPNVQLAEHDAEEIILKRTASACFMSTPHFGTPLANFFTTLQGKHILQILAIMATTSGGRHGIFLAAKALSLTARLDDWMGRTDTFLDELSQKLLRRLSLDKDDPFFHFLTEIASDQGAVIQLTPEGMNLFNAAVTIDPKILSCSLITGVPHPNTRFIRECLSSPRLMFMGTLFSILQVLAGREHPHYPYPFPSQSRIAEIAKGFSFPVDGTTNDGIVPTLSQIYGDRVVPICGDHLDVVGQYPNADGDHYTDWLPSPSGFNRERFSDTWEQVAKIIKESV
ncbi:hypothetical protein KKF84_10130 [Myxococcota bacterium]|nr:hypothetical protein [Myxococcota bacterium]